MSVMRMWMPVVAVLWLSCTPAAPEEPATECSEGRTRACGTGVGECTSGTERCADGRWSGVCEGGVQPVAERCNLVDDDCDGTTDEAGADCEVGAGVERVSCRFGTCTIEECSNPLLGSCDYEYRNGCETELTVWRHCGACARTCDGEQTCRDGECVDLVFDRRLVTFAGVLQDDLLDVAVGTDESVFALFRYRDVIAFGAHGFASPGPGSDLVLAKMDRAGTILWAVATESEDREEARIAAGPDGGVFVAGAFPMSTRFAGRNVDVPLGAVVPFVAHLDGAGALRWLTEGAGVLSVLDIASDHGTLVLSVRAWEAARLGALPIPMGTSVVWVGESGSALDAIAVPTVDDSGVAIAITQPAAAAISGRVEGVLSIGDEEPIESPVEGPVLFAAELDFVTGSSSWTRFVLGAESVSSLSTHERGIDLLGRGGPVITAGEQELSSGSSSQPFLLRLDGAGIPTHLARTSGEVWIESVSYADVFLASGDTVAAYPHARWSRSLGPGSIRATASGERVLAVGGELGASAETIDGVPVVHRGGGDVFVWWLTVR